MCMCIIKLASAISVALHTAQRQSHFEHAYNSLVLLTVMLPLSKYSVQQKQTYY